MLGCITQVTYGHSRACAGSARGGPRPTRCMRFTHFLFYPFVDSPPKANIPKSLLCAVRPFHAWLGASLPSHSSSVNESAGQDELPRRAMRDTPLVGRALSDSTCKMCALSCMLDRAGMGGSHFRLQSSPKMAEVCGPCDSCEERALSDSVSNMRAVRCTLVSTTLERAGAPRLTIPFHIHGAIIGSRLAVRCTPLS